MKKSYNPITDVSNEKNELSRRIYRSLSEVVRQLDDIRGRSQSVSNLFVPCLAPLKARLHDLCYKLILTDPLGYGKRGEELLWRKGYHDMFTTAKRLRRNDAWSTEDATHVQGLLLSGIGHYQHFLFQLQTDYGLHFGGAIDFPLNSGRAGPNKGEIPHYHKEGDKSIIDWAMDACHRCLIYLGDLNRYLLDIYPLWDSGTAERYYIQAANMNMQCGRPFNQLGTLASGKNYNLDAVYNYVRCMIRSEPFQGAEGNLRKALEKNAESMQLEPFLPNPAPSLQKLIMRFLFFFDVWYFEKSFDTDLHNLCHEMLQELQFCLREEKVNLLSFDCNEIDIENVSPFRDRSSGQSDYLNSDMILKMIILLFICVDKLHKNDSSHASVVAAMSLAMFSQLLQHAIEKFQLFFSRHGSDVYSNGSLKLSSSQTSSSSSSSSSSTSSSSPSPSLSKTTAETHRENQKHENMSKELEMIENRINEELNIKSETQANKKEKKDASGGNSESAEATVKNVPAKARRMKKKTRLKRRKRIRSIDSDSDLTDSDITLNETSSDEASSSGNSDSEEVVSSESEDLDETLLIIDRKIKSKNNKEKMKDSDVAPKTVDEGNEEKLLAGTNGAVLERNGDKQTSGETDELTNSQELLTNGTERYGQMTMAEPKPSSRGNWAETPNGKTPASPEYAAREGCDSGENARDADSNFNLSSLRHVDGKKFLLFLSQQGVLRPVKLYCDWFLADPEVLKACCKSSKTLLGKLVTFLNLITFDEEIFAKEWTKIKDKSDCIPLSEDVITRGLPMLDAAQGRFDWNYHNTNRISYVQENLLRLKRLIDFGHHLCKFAETEVQYSERSNIFFMGGQNGKSINSSSEVETSTSVDNKHMSSASRKGQLMKHMGQLWLKAEVRDLESRVRRRASNFSPYLVVDSEALIDHIVLVKQLVGSRQFIVIIPTVVLSHLDECKRDSGRARETIRWLESQFQHGNRSLRAQKSQERISLPLIKYPKKKDKEAWNFFQIVECCHYFSKQSEFHCSQPNLLVTLLTGQRDASLTSDSNKREECGKDYSPMGIAKNFGINLEHIESFHTKWKLSTKSHG